MPLALQQHISRLYIYPNKATHELYSSRNFKPDFFKKYTKIKVEIMFVCFEIFLFSCLPTSMEHKSICDFRISKT